MTATSWPGTGLPIAPARLTPIAGVSPEPIGDASQAFRDGVLPFTDAFALALVIAILLMRPNGLFGRRVEVAT